MKTCAVAKPLLLRYRDSIRVILKPVKSRWGAFVTQASRKQVKWDKSFRMGRNRYILWGSRKEGGRLGLSLLDWEYVAPRIGEELPLNRGPCGYHANHMRRATNGSSEYSATAPPGQPLRFGGVIQLLPGRQPETQEAPSRRKAPQDHPGTIGGISVLFFSAKWRPMVWFIVMQVFSTVLEWPRLGKPSEPEKDLEILPLRRRLAILE